MKNYLILFAAIAALATACHPVLASPDKAKPTPNPFKERILISRQHADRLLAERERRFQAHVELLERSFVAPAKPDDRHLKCRKRRSTGMF
jgi:hypothetical protein